MNLEGAAISAETRAEIEMKIQEDKAKLNGLLSEQKASQLKEREEKFQQASALKQTSTAAVELILSEVGKKLQSSDAIIKLLKVGC